MGLMNRLSVQMRERKSSGANAFSSFVVNHFFDQSKVINAIDKKKIESLKKAGAYTRAVARNLIKTSNKMGVPKFFRDRYDKAVRNAIRRKERVKYAAPLEYPLSAPPGKPPYDKTGVGTNKKIGQSRHSGYLRNSIFFGYDVLAGSAIVGPPKMYSGTANVLEHGGTAVLPDYKGDGVTMKFAGNPFMGPALKKAAPKVGDFFKNIL